MVFYPKNDVTHWKQKVAIATSDYNAFEKIYKMTAKGVTLKSESFFSISYGVLELWRKNLKGGGGIPSPPRVQIGLRGILIVV